MKIVFFTENYYCGGLDTFIINLINHWPNESDQLILLGNSSHPGLSIIEDNINITCKVIRYNAKTYSSLLIGLKDNILINKAIKKLLNIISPIFRYYFIISNIFSILRILKNVNPDRLMIINGGYPGGDACRAASVSWRLLKKEVLSIHNFHNIVITPKWYIRLQEYLIDLMVARSSKKFITVSKAAADSMINRPVIQAKAEIIYIWNGIDVSSDANYNDRNNLKIEIGIPSDSHLCLMLGTYEQRKGHLFMLQAFKKVIEQIPSAYLLICGHGYKEDVDRVVGYIENNDLKRNVRLMDFRKDISFLFNSSDVLLLPSQSFESFGLTSVEAMAHRIPVVATRVGGIPEVVVDGEGGFCVEKDDIDGYAHKIICLLQDKKLRLEQGTKGYKRYKRYFTAERMALEYSKILHEPF